MSALTPLLNLHGRRLGALRIQHSELHISMIRPLRQRHRIAVLTLSAFLPAVFVLGIASRRVVPLVGSSPRGLSQESADTYKSLWVRDDLWEKKPLRTKLLTDSKTSKLKLEVTAAVPSIRPDVLLYWVSGTPTVEDSLPNDAILVGAWTQESANALDLPLATRATQGKLVLYSLADHEIVNVSKPFAIP